MFRSWRKARSQRRLGSRHSSASAYSSFADEGPGNFVGAPPMELITKSFRSRSRLVKLAQERPELLVEVLMALAPRDLAAVRASGTWARFVQVDEFPLVYDEIELAGDPEFPFLELLIPLPSPNAADLVHSANVAFEWAGAGGAETHGRVAVVQEDEEDQATPCEGWDAADPSAAMPPAKTLLGLQAMHSRDQQRRRRRAAPPAADWATASLTYYVGEGARAVGLWTFAGPREECVLRLRNLRMRRLAILNANA